MRVETSYRWPLIYAKSRLASLTDWVLLLTEFSLKINDPKKFLCHSNDWTISSIVVQFLDDELPSRQMKNIQISKLKGPCHLFCYIIIVHNTFSKIFFDIFQKLLKLNRYLPWDNDQYRKKVALLWNHLGTYLLKWFGIVYYQT